MKNVITSINAWLSDNLPDVDLRFGKGEASQFPSVVVSIGEANETGSRRCSESPLLKIAVECVCIADGRDAGTARGLAMRILELVTGDSDRASQIPRFEWDYEAAPPAPVREVGRMAITGVFYAEDFDAKMPEIRLARVAFTVRARM
jgi:hypothetical protein